VWGAGQMEMVYRGKANKSRIEAAYLNVCIVLFIQFCSAVFRSFVSVGALRHEQDNIKSEYQGNGRRKKKHLKEKWEKKRGRQAQRNTRRREQKSITKQKRTNKQTNKQRSKQGQLAP